MKNSLKCSGTLKGIDAKTGKVLFQVHNMFVQTGLNEIAKFMAKKSPVQPAYMAVGNSAVPTVNEDTKLKGTELARLPFGSVELAGNTVKYTTTYLAGVGTGTWEEVGIFSASAAGVMFSRATTGTYTKGPKDEIKVIWTYKFSDASAA